MIACDRTRKWRVGNTTETAVSVVVKTGQLSTFAAADNQILITVAIQITPRHSRPKLTQPLRQQGLSLEVVEGVFVVNVRYELTHVLEQWSRIGDW